MAAGKLSGDDSGAEEVKVPPNYAFEPTGEPSVRARVRRVQLLGPSARLECLRPAAQRRR